jgi:hypothetical protein
MTMSGVWKTKYGPRRVREEAPTLDEAIYAASGLTDDHQQQVAIAASLMGLPPEEVKAAVLKAAQRKDVNRASRPETSRVMFTQRAGHERAVVVERKVSVRGGRSLG